MIKRSTSHDQKAGHMTTVGGCIITHALMTVDKSFDTTLIINIKQWLVGEQEEKPPGFRLPMRWRRQSLVKMR